MRSDAACFERALGRMNALMVSLSVFGIAAAWCLQGWLYAMAFLLGAAASLLNFRWLRQLVAALGETTRHPRRRLLFFLSLRYLLLGLFGYVIVVFFGLNLAAAVAGLFVPVAAVILEIIYELIYARA